VAEIVKWTVNNPNINDDNHPSGPTMAAMAMKLPLMFDFNMRCRFKSLCLHIPCDHSN
jgi:hypothetical protein